MLKVEELKRIELFENFRLVAGAEGLGRVITNTTILEYETYTNGYQVFKRGDFILTSLFFAKDDPDMIRDSLSELNAREVSAVAVKTSFYNTIPQDAIDYANEKKMPLFLFDETDMEDIIVCINDIIKKKESYQLLEKEISRFLDAHSAREVVNFAHHIGSFPYGRYAVTYLTPKDVNVSVQYIFENMSYRWKQYKEDMHISNLKYKNGIMFIYCFPAQEQPQLMQVIAEEMRGLKLSIQDFYCGISLIQTEVIDLQKAMEQSLYANRICKIRCENALAYDEIGIYQYICPLLKDKALMEQYNHTIQVLKQYDQEYTSNLFATLQCFVRHHGKISETAKEMFQHSNTIRYRLQKAEELIQAEHFYEYIFLVMNLYQLLED